MRIPKINVPKKYLKIAGWTFGVLAIILFATGAVAYSKREALLTKMVNRAVSKAQRDYGLKVRINEYGFRGLSTVHLSGVSVVPENRDTLSSISELTVSVKLFPLLFGNVKLSQVNLDKGSFSVVLKDSVTNLDFFLKRKKDSTEKKGKMDLSSLASNLLNQVLYKIPDDMDLRNFRFSLNDNDTASLDFLVSRATIDDGDLESTILVNGNAATWHANGALHPGRKKLNIMVFAEGRKVELPYLNNKLNARISFDTVQTELKDAGYSGGEFKISGSWAVKNLLINQQRIASNDIIVPNARLDAEVFVGENYLGLDSASTIYVDKASLHPFLQYTLTPNKVYEMKVRAEEQDAQAIFNALPVGMFESLGGLKVSGKLRYDMEFLLDTAEPDSVKFNSTLTPTNFKILKWGKVNLQKINSDFVYTPYEYGKKMRDIVIGPSNPNFTPLNEISPNFKNGVLTAEDPSFFSHKGFVQESIRKSIVVNFKEKKFVRGGSTISMQLVKNVYLSRQKTLARKVEEILIVWLIENNRLVSKSRMLEVYFNIMELGQNVYGIGEASRHYFGKRPADLTVGEGLFLTNIVPRPKIALYKFRGDGGLKDYLLPYFRFIGNIMARRGLTPVDTNGYGFYNVRLREGLRQYLAPDTATVDTTAFDEDGITMPVMMQDENKSLFDRLFGKPASQDTARKNPVVQDTVPKSKRELRLERREQRRREREQENPVTQ
ncbi:penicillin-binding protein [Pedobacter yulinensis]|uniref:Penicillin-binding protein n=1 Tax=Pedobacter yulinensis TaxID=2126353 RepID=A0A2T3HRD8_9SPHI|nr:transglycosylase domain-containing protein [Pedobacter yulinensis]PST85024.1 penicillin-binding protein [Pedobacter yulinensis]